MAKKITINDVAQLLRISTETIRFYEKKKIVNPKRDGDNSYRYFTQADIRRLYDCRIYQSMGFSLSEIIDIFRETSSERLDHMIAEKEEQLQKTVQEDMLALDRIRQVKAANDKAEHGYGKFFIMESPHYLASFHSDHNELNSNTIRHHFWDCVADYYNLFTCAALISPEIVKSSCVHDEMRMGYTINFEDAKKLNLYPDSHVMEFAPRRCVYTLFHAEPVVNADVLAPALHWMQEHGFILKGDILCSTIKITFRDGMESRIYEAWFPIDD